MNKIFGYLTLLLGAAAAAAVIAAPSASAADVPVCANLGSATQCQSPGNAEINAAPPVQLGGAPFSIYGPFFTYDRGGR